MKHRSFKVFLLFSLFLLSVGVSMAFGQEGPAGLPGELKGLRIDDQVIQSTAKSVGSVETIHGTGRLVILRRGEQKAYYAREGDKVYEKDALYTLSDCRSRILFDDKNVVVLAPDSHLDIDEVYASVLQGIKKSRFGMMRGKAIFYALKLFRYKEMRLDLRTPTATVGVRGTQFGSEIERVNREAARNIITRAYVFEGEINVTSLIDGKSLRLHENEILEAGGQGLGDVVLDPERTKAFLGDILTGIETTPAPKSRILDEGFRQEELDRLDTLDDVRQRQLGPPVHEIPSGGQHP